MRRRAFPGHGPEVDARYERAGHWLRATIYQHEKSQIWCAQKGLTFKAQSEGVNSAGGYLVPVELSDVIADLRDMYGVTRRRARPVPMGTDSTSVAKYTGGVTGYFAAENTAGTSSQDTIDSTTLTAKKVFAEVLLSSELEDDSLPEAVDFFVNEIAWAFAKAEDGCTFNGDGTSTYGGMRGITTIAIDGSHTKANVAAASTHKTFLTLDATDLGNVIASVRASALARAAWYISQWGFGQTMCRLAGTSNGFIETREVDGLLTPCFNGFPVIMTEQLPATASSQAGAVMLAFGDLYAGAMIGQRRQITIARSAERYFELDQIAIRGTERVHIVVHDIGSTTTFGSLSALVGTT